MTQPLTSDELSRRPLLRWAGSKRRLIPKLAGYWSSKFEKYVEPFCGCAALYFALKPRKAVIADINQELMITYKAVKSHPDRVARILSRWQPNKSTYYRLRSIPPEKLSDAGRAARFIFLNRLCFNGIYRTNLNGQFNVPYSGEKNGRIPPPETLSMFSKSLSGVTLLQSDFEQTIDKEVSKNSFVYLDPPYFTGGRRVFVEYSSKPFSISDLDRLDKCLREIDDRGAFFVLSYQLSSDIRRRFSRWHQTRVSVLRNVAGFAESRRSSQELLISNFEKPT
jgi:DNA adenine methylase